MTKKKIPDLIGRAETAEILGVKSSNLDRLAGLPEPVHRVRATPLWERSAIEALRDKREARTTA